MVLPAGYAITSEPTKLWKLSLPQSGHIKPIRTKYYSLLGSIVCGVYLLLHKILQFTSYYIQKAAIYQIHTMF